MMGQCNMPEACSAVYYHIITDMWDTQKQNYNGLVDIEEVVNAERDSHIGYMLVQKGLKCRHKVQCTKC